MFRLWSAQMRKFGQACARAPPRAAGAPGYHVLLAHKERLSYALDPHYARRGEQFLIATDAYFTTTASPVEAFNKKMTWLNGRLSYDLHGIVLYAHESALGDAERCARAVDVVLDRLASDGHSPLDFVVYTQSKL